MPTTTDQYRLSYGDVSRVDDVMGAVEILTAEEDFLFTSLQRNVARDTIHATLTDTLKTAGSNSHPEGGNYTYLGRTTPSRITNLVQTLTIPFIVSDIQDKVEKFHGRSELERQTEKALREFANDAEFNLLRSTLTSGASNATPTMDGVINLISKHASNCVTTQTSGTALVASILNGLVKLNYDNSNGELATDLFVGSYLRDVIDGFTQKTNSVVNNPGGMMNIINSVTTYTTSFSVLSVHTHRYINVSGTDATGRMLLLRPEKWGLAFLESPYIDTGIGRDGTATPRSVVSSFTVECMNPSSNVFAEGYNIG